MVIRKPLGEILEHFGVVTHDQVVQALEKQRTLAVNQSVPENLQRARMVSEYRTLRDVRKVPLLGQILVDMGMATEDQILLALNEQEQVLEIYESLGSRKLGTVLEIGALINGTLNITEVLTLIMQHVNRLTNSVAGTLMLRDEETDELVFSVPTGPKADDLTDIRIPPGKGIAGWVAANQRYALIPDAATDERFYREIDRHSGFQTRTLLCVPIKAKDKLIGVLEVINKEDGGVFTEEDALLLSIFAGQASLAIENARLYSELKQRWEKEQQLERRWAESEKLQALGQLATGIAHDFNNILSAIMGYSEMTLHDVEAGGKARANLNEILQASQRASDLVRQIMAFARKTDAQHKPVDLMAVINEALTLIKASFPRSITVQATSELPKATILADATQIHQVLVNLCTNAMHAMPSGGVLSVNVASCCVACEPEPAPGSLPPGDYLCLTVSDTGHGIAPDILPRIFEPYFTTKHKGMGTGMGLAVVQGIVRSHGGAVEVTSTVDQGTQIHVWLPQMAYECLLAEAAAQPEPIATGSERILFVDDESPLVSLGCQMFERLGYRVVGRTDSNEALRLFAEDPDGFDLVITDLMMPRLTGDRLARELLAIRPDIPIVLCTGYSERLDSLRSAGIGVRRILLKPLAMRKLAETVRAVLDDGTAGGSAVV